MNRAHVWICTKMQCEARLVVYAGRVAHNSGATPVATGERVALERLGARMYMHVLRVDLPATVLPGAVLSYDVRVFEPNSESGLFRLGLLGGIEADVGAEYDERRAAVPLGYTDGMLPSFVMPADHASELRVVHASCRKPHGGKQDEPDALQLVDAMIANSVGTAPTEVRPQQLILTGDQIYADDVAAGLLAALTEAGDQLLGWTEALPLATGVSEFLVDPGWRTRYLSLDGVDLKEPPADEKKADYSQSHLLRFGEWCAMYLFAWSDALWRIDSHGNYDLPQHPSTINMAALQKALDLADTIGLVVVPARAAKALEIADWLNEFNEQLKTHWKESRPKALRFAHSVRSVRRALANVSTYTMFDDHEITDDWYLNRRVHDKLKGVGGTGDAALVGPRLLRNGLSAYAFFQHWGNVPDDFVDGARGRDLLDKWRIEDGATACLMTTDPRDADTLLAITPGDSAIPPSLARHDFVRVRWDYAIAFPCHRLVVLDTRTWRYFPPGTPLTWASLAPLIPKPPGLAADAGADELADVVASWRAAGVAASDTVMAAFADLVDAYVAIAHDVTQQRSVLISHTTTFLHRLDVLLRRLPGRAAVAQEHRVDPIRSPLWTALVNPTLLGPMLASLTDPQVAEWIVGALRVAADIDFGAASDALTQTLLALADFVDMAFHRSTVGMVFAAKRVADHAGGELWSVLTDVASSHPAHVQLIAAITVTLTQLDQLTQAVGLDRLASAIFRDGSNRKGVGLIRADATPFMVTEPLNTIAPRSAVTLLLSPAPIFGNRLVELAQRAKLMLLIAQGKAAEEEVDFEPWSANVPAMISLFKAARTIGCAVVLSGDVHYAGSSVNVVSLADEESRTSFASRYVQLTSSAARNADSMTNMLGLLDDLLYDEDGTAFLMQSDWAGEFEHGSSSVGHLANLASARIGELFDDMKNVPGNAWSWFWSTSITLEDVVDRLERVVAAPMGTARALSRELGWQLYAAISTIEQFADDPILSIFGDFLSAGEITRDQLRWFYGEIGLDPGSGLNVVSTPIRDHRSARVSAYPVRTELQAGTSAFKVANARYRRTVGNANVGVVSFGTRGTQITEVRHELRWYPSNAPPRAFVSGVLVDPVMRTDWMGTLHRAGWIGVAPDVGRHSP